MVYTGAYHSIVQCNDRVRCANLTTSVQYSIPTASAGLRLRVQYVCRTALLLKGSGTAIWQLGTAPGLAAPSSRMVDPRASRCVRARRRGRLHLDEQLSHVIDRTERNA